MTPSSLEESLAVRETMPERILPSRFHSRKTLVGEVDTREMSESVLPLNSDHDGGPKRCAKSRWIIARFSDPDILALTTTSRHHCFKL